MMRLGSSMFFGVGLPLLSLLLLGGGQLVRGEYGDYADTSFDCPATTTCRTVCVNDTSLCTGRLMCNSTLGEELCADGTCSDSCDEDAESPCEYDCAPYACKIDTWFYDSCTDTYEDLYGYMDFCYEEEDAYETELFSFREPGFLFCYFWVVGVIFLMLAWCAFNQRLSPVAGSTKPIIIPSGDGAEDSGFATQTAYRNDLVGIGCYSLVMITLIGFQVLIGIIIILYYHTQEVMTRWERLIFEDEVQSLIAFELAWCTGFAFTFALKWPHSVYSLFLRRCTFARTSHVCVLAPVDVGAEVGTHTGTIANIRQILTVVGKCFNFFMKMLFSDIDRPAGGSGFEIKYCQVQTADDAAKTRYFTYRLRRYIYDPNAEAFVPGSIEGTFGSTVGDIGNSTNIKTGLSDKEVESRTRRIGPNTISLPQPSIIGSIIKEFSTPFYTYQHFFVLSWIPLWYYYMAIVWFFIVVTGGLTTAYFRHKNEQTLYRLSLSEGEARVRRNGDWKNLSHKELVPGDVVVLSPGITYCDMVVLKQTSLVIDESALSGESNPVAKSAIDITQKDDVYDPILTHKKNTILAGTIILESSGTDSGDIGLVTKTGSFTSKGEMLRDILSSSRVNFKFDEEVKIVLLILLTWAIVAFFITARLIQDDFVYGWFYGIYVFATALPPLLPTVFVVSVGFSGSRLEQKKRIVCSDNQIILVAGKVSHALFDKTGTLTKQGLDFMGTRAATSFEKLSVDSIPSDELQMGVACCHTLAHTSTGELIGNAVDQMMFAASKSKMEQTPGDNKTLTINTESGATFWVIRRFEFDHTRMTQTVIVRTKEKRVFAIVKGSDQSIKKLCLPDTLPASFDTVVRDSAKEGVYQISMASKEIGGGLDISGLSRDEIEYDFTFTGSIDFKNTIREETAGVIQNLKAGSVQCTMVTGDSVVTGIKIARESGILQEKEVLIASEISEGMVCWFNEDDKREGVGANFPLQPDQNQFELAMKGSVWAQLYSDDKDTALRLVDRICVFGRCSPQEKVIVVQAMNDAGHITAMCGDGGNDCGALKTAHVGIALSEHEASMVSAFTSLDKSITSVLDVLLEGRCALANAFASYKYMLMYGQVETVNQMACAYYAITFGDWNWIFMDGVWMITMALALPLSKPQTTLSKFRPTASLLGFHTILSFMGVFLINLAFLVIGLWMLYQQDWYQCRKWTSVDVSNVSVIGDNYESSVIFLVTGYQYVSSGLAYNFGYSFREPFYKNWVVVLLGIAFTTLHFLATISEGKISCFFRVNCMNEDIEAMGPTIMTYLGGEREPLSIQNPFNTTLMPEEFRWKLVIIIALNTVLIMGYEYFIINGIGATWARSLNNKEVSPKEVNDINSETSV